MSAPVLCEPLKGLLPLHPPDPAQDVAFDELQVKFDEEPPLTLLCEVLIDAVGGAAEPEGPPPPQDANNASHAAAATLRLEKFMPLREMLQLCITVTIAHCN